MENVLKDKLAKYKITNRECATLWDVTECTASLKINGKSIVTLNEAFMLQEYIHEKTGEFVSLNRLFKS